jgi:hypothetical protein
MSVRSVGDELSIKGYFLTSKNIDKAKNGFASVIEETEEDGSKVSVQRIGIVDGRAENVFHLMKNEYEEEILYPRGQKFKVTK